MSHSSDIPDGQREPNTMDRLHAYWRMPYITGELPKDAPKHKNPFSQIHLSDNDRENLILFRARWNYIVLNRYPYNAGHLLVLPYREVASLDKLTEHERHELIDLINLAQSLLTQALQPDGFNTGFNFGQAGGAGIPVHLHCHVVPRWNGDTNFMPVIGHSRVLPESLDAMWQRLKQVSTDSLPSTGS